MLPPDPCVMDPVSITNKVVKYTPFRGNLEPDPQVSLLYETSEMNPIQYQFVAGDQKT